MAAVPDAALEKTATPAATATRLLNRNFVLLWQGQLVSQIGAQAFSIAMIFWIKQATGSASLMGLLLMLSSLPGVILGPVAGTFADRHSRRAIIIVCDVLSGLAVLSLVAVMWWLPGLQELSLAWLFATSVAVSVLAAFFRPAISAAIPDLVPLEKVSAANAMNQASVQVATLVGQGLGGVLFRLLGAPVLFLADGIAYLFSAFSELFIRIPQKIPERGGHWKELFSAFKRDTLEGFRYVWQRPGMRNFFLAVAVLNFFSMPFIVLLPFYVEDVLRVQSDWYGYLLAAFGGGALAGYALAGVLKLPARARSWAIFVMLIGFGVVFVLLSQVRMAPLALALMAGVGVMSGFINISIMTLMQISTPSEIRGRVFGFLSTLSAGLIPLGMGISGVVADWLGQDIPLIYGVSGLLAAGLSAWIAIPREFRAFLAYEPTQPPIGS
ncbi:MAG TPA: MFS transporter [Candidatus Bipolaricaulota bacterium]